jgi:pimeloyl-ACP methyl ester carboxylesterase
MKLAAKNPRVVVIPGLMGSALIDDSIPKKDAEAQCQKHWDSIPLVRDSLLSAGNTLCGDESNSIWGRAAFLHWLADLDGWLKLMTHGDGKSTPGVVKAARHTELIVKLGQGKEPLESIPYLELVKKLEAAGADVLPFVYDWRLSAPLAVKQLRDAILLKWFDGRVPSSRPSEPKRVMLIGHSMGGLIARMFIENSSADASLVRHAILVGVPNKGAPEAYGHFTGTKKFGTDTSLSTTWKTTQDVAALDPTVGVKSVSFDLNPLVKHCASIIELFPRYDFVEDPIDPGEKEKYTKTFEKTKHDPSRTPALELLKGVSDLLRDHASLEYWLLRNDITYDVISTTDLPTDVGMKRTRGSSGFSMALDEKGGDGTVPTFSAVGWLGPPKYLASITRTDVKQGAKFRKHSQMCQNAEVQSLCVNRLQSRPEPRATGRRMGKSDVPEFLKIARDIFLSGRAPFFDKEVMRGRTIVICCALVQGTKLNEPLFDPTTKEIGGKKWLVKELKGTDATRMVYEGRTGRTHYSFVELAPNSVTRSGVVFLPTYDEDYIHIFGIVAKRWDPQDSERHAERQVQYFLEAQRRERNWQGAIQDIFFWNESLTRRGGGYSPCASCCDALAAMWCPDKLSARRMEWKELFTDRDGGKNKTTKASLAKMENAKPVPWSLSTENRP